VIVIRSGRVLTSVGWRNADVLIGGGVVREVGRGMRAETVIDASGCLVGPGFVDMHTHLREPGETWKEDIESASRAAVRGGFTAVVAMPNTSPPADSPKVTDMIARRGQEVGVVDVVPSSAMTVGRVGATPVDIEGMYEAGARLFTDDGDCVTDEDVLREIMLRIGELPGAFVAQHAEDHARTADGHLHDGELARSKGVGVLPAEAESDIVRRDLALVEETGAQYHCQHISSRATVDLIRQAKTTGLPVTAEVTPHHLNLDITALDTLDTNLKMYPPLRSAEDRAALVAALSEGTIDVVATDHAPHSVDEKAVSFVDAPRGVIGLETAASVVWETLENETRMFETLAMAPARIMGMPSHGQVVAPGSPANLVVFDPNVTWGPGEFASRSANSPYLGSTMRGRVEATIYSGSVVYRRSVAA
jgi:dihydroorotase